MLCLILVLLLAAPAAADMISDAKADISNSALDPESVRWRNLRMAASTDAPFVCGEFLAKNRFGAYTGWQQFMWDGPGELFTRRSVVSVGLSPSFWASTYARCF